MSAHLFIFIVSFFGIWFGAGLAIKSVEKLSRSIHLSSFLTSFLLLGFFTSLSELSVGINSIIVRDPEIYVGNLIGASLVLFMLVIPLLSLFGGSIKVSPELQSHNLPLSLLVISIPVLLSIDGKVTKADGIFALTAYITLIVFLQAKSGLISNIQKNIKTASLSTGKTVLSILAGVAIIFISSHFLVEQTLYFSKVLSVSPFLISLLVISLGTNIPELSLAIRSAFMKNNQIAFGDYVGSAAFNTFLFSALTLFNKQTVTLTNSYLVSLSFMIIGLILFYYFARSKSTISKSEAVCLLFLYCLFLFTEAYLHKNVFIFIN